MLAVINHFLKTSAIARFWVTLFFVICAWGLPTLWDTTQAYPRFDRTQENAVFAQNITSTRDIPGQVFYGLRRNLDEVRGSRGLGIFWANLQFASTDLILYTTAVIMIEGTSPEYNGVQYIRFSIGAFASFLASLLWCLPSPLLRPYFPWQPYYYSISNLWYLSPPSLLPLSLVNHLLLTFAAFDTPLRLHPAVQAYLVLQLGFVHLTFLVDYTYASWILLMTWSFCWCLKSRFPYRKADFLAKNDNTTAPQDAQSFQTSAAVFEIGSPDSPVSSSASSSLGTLTSNSVVFAPQAVHLNRQDRDLLKMELELMGVNGGGEYDEEEEQKEDQLP